MTSTLPPFIQAFSGAIGSAAANTLTYPPDLIGTRQKLDPLHIGQRTGGIRGAFHLLRRVINKHGLGVLYDGL